MSSFISDDGGATFGSDGLSSAYRYHLWRKLKEYPGRDERRLGFIMLNPSTATHELLDPTVRRCLGFAKKLGYGWLDVGNLFAYRTTYPAELVKARDPVGPDNDQWLKVLAIKCETLICAWTGGNALVNARAAEVRKMLSERRQLHVLRLNNDGSPSHPLYLPGDLTPQPW